ncbi:MULTISPECIES: threonine/serine exporter family protein [Clostridium]|uniref:Threonine/serine exporter n=1 Tax=Clostridium cadaveris TaxID=1529 RepID=A0A1I2MQC7_9CLOT|nr:threonine/serine exporter family protein [Clostridium cadaveris]MDU4951043.1 threonine/serine exporter family protein [Clostridium sp.]MDM8311644.1 threonine/serine exporter family protein [Clostridium cadaveris]NME65062.1 threonine/serine exporter [Clostridium cadaveris]PWL52988.1 MAG: threonine/serine exporter [Clostridium cadaveris]UFH66295.1 threonine/serine exporter family protein [Clostridium cadaveris]
MVLNSIYSLIASLSFGVLFNIKGKKLIFAGIGGGIAWFVYELCILAGFSDITSLFIGSVALSIYGEFAARILKSPVTIFVICALIPLVPGKGMYNTLLASVQGDVYLSLEIGLHTILSAGAIAIGIMLVSTISKFLSHLIQKNKARNSKSLKKSSK